MAAGAGVPRGVIITRPEPGLSETMAEAARLGWVPVACPMLKIRGFAPVPAVACEAVAVTSGNALAALAEWPRDRLLLAVGEKTAARARAMGFAHVEAAGGDSRALAGFCRARGIGGAGLVIASGEGYGLDLAEELGARRIETYAAEPEERLSPLAAEALGASGAQGTRLVEAVCFYSGRTADSFMDALEALSLAALGEVRALCLSEAVAARLPRGMWGSVEWPDPLALLGPFGRAVP